MKINGVSYCDYCKCYLSSASNAPDKLLCLPCELEELKSAIRGLLEAFPMSATTKQTEAVIVAHRALGVKMHGDK